MIPIKRAGTGLLAALLSALTPLAYAAPNGYTQIPIAKVFGNGVAAFSFTSSRLGQSSTLYTTQYGLLNRFEVGLDYQALPRYQEEFLGNAKYLLVHEPGRLPDVACGLQNLAVHQRGVPYLVVTTQPRATGVSLGFIRPGSGGYVGMGGVSYNATPNLQVVADAIGGRGAYGTLGIIAAVSKTTTVNLAYGQPNTAGLPGARNPRGFVLNLSYTFHALHGKESGSSGGTNKNPTAGAGAS